MNYGFAAEYLLRSIISRMFAIENFIPTPF